ncbi:MAG: hypothetical protein IBX72_03880 [Nitrospirae bacterium]|nr:hypothetical protein [Nitrospirota bacterium]
MNPKAPISPETEETIEPLGLPKIEPPAVAEKPTGYVKELLRESQRFRLSTKGYCILTEHARPL